MRPAPSGRAFRRRFNDPSVYTKGTGAVYPLQDMIGAQYVVSKVASSDGIGGTYVSNYAYAGGKTDLSGRGFLGFSQVTVRDPQLHTTQTTTYRMDFPFTGEVASQVKVFTPSGGAPVTLSSVANTYQTDPACAGGTPAAPPYMVALCTSTAQSADTDGSAFPSVTTSNTYDGFGNVLTSTSLVSDGSSKTTTNTWFNDTTNWFLGRLLTSNVQSVVGGSNLTRHSSFAYDPASGLVTAEIAEPQDTGALRLETDTLYDAFGNKHVTTAVGLAATPSGLASQSRPTTASYDARGQFATTLMNALGESEQWSYNGDYGTPATHTGPNGATTAWSYDSFGRVTRAADPDGTATLYSYTYCTTGCPTNAAYFVQATPVGPDGQGNGAVTIAYYDSLSRVIATDTASFDTAPAPWIRSETHYDSFGHVASASRPYFLGVDTPVFTVSSFTMPSGDIDPLGRAFRVTAPDASVTTFTYDALVTSVTNARGATTTTTKNAQGLVALVTDANGQGTSYSYDAFGDMVTANPPGPAIVHFTYDLRGRKLTAADPDMGNWSYSYDAFGALYQQTDAKLQTSTMAYDPLGRLVSRTEPDMVSSWTYGTDVTHHNIDKLLTATCSGAACGAGYTRSYLYDGLSRQARVTIAVGGLTYYTNTLYDPETGKVGQTRNFGGFILDYAYTPRGYLTTIKDDATGLAYFTANARNASLQLTNSTAGNSVATTNSFDFLTGRMLNVCASNHAGSCDGAIANIATDFDVVGNLTNRGDTLHGVTEAFGYDQLNRLTSTNLTSQSQNLSRTMRYNSAGSITEKSDICPVNNCFAYGATQVHALASITGGTVNGVVNPTFSYDPNGNMMSGPGRTASYTSFNMVQQANQGTTTLNLLYDPEHSRIQQTAPEGSTYYFNDAASGAMTERVFPTTGSSLWRSYILADGKIVAERSVKGSTVTVRYFVLDHLGSTIALTKEDGTLAESDAYDPWGKARDAATGADDTTCSKPAQSFSTRGYTGQEEMPDLCLVNMNARIYDPTIGRFMSPDDVIQDPYNGQNYNRYTYVDDNPLSYTDPTGHDINIGWATTPEVVPVNAPRQPNGDEASISLHDNPDPYWPHNEIVVGPSSTMAHNGAHAVSSGLTAGSKSPSGLSAPSGLNDASSPDDANGEIRIAAGADEDAEAPKRSIIDDFFDPLEPLRSETFLDNMIAIRRLNPASGALSRITPDGWTPTQEDVSESQRDLEVLRAQVARQIAGGHAYTDHAEEFGSPAREVFERYVRAMLSDPRTQVRDLARGRTSFYYDRTNILVIVDPASPDSGTMFRPTRGQAYVNELK